jgi:hypothetical protein
MITPPIFASLQEHVSRLGDIEPWQPYIAEILERHHLTDTGRQPAAAFNATYPTFLYGDVVVKLFGYSRAWRASHAGERAAYASPATDPDMAAPRLLAEGQLYDDVDPAWPYLVTWYEIRSATMTYSKCAGDERRAEREELNTSRAVDNRCCGCRNASAPAPQLRDKVPCADVFPGS